MQRHPCTAMGSTRRALAQCFASDPAASLAGCGKCANVVVLERRAAATCEPRIQKHTTGNQWVRLCSWVPGLALTGRPGITRELLGTLPVSSSAARGFRGRGNLMIVDTSAQPGALDVLHPAWGVRVHQFSDNITALRQSSKRAITVLADALHRASQTVTVSQSFHTVSRLFA